MTVYRSRTTRLRTASAVAAPDRVIQRRRETDPAQVRHEQHASEGPPREERHRGSRQLRATGGRCWRAPAGGCGVRRTRGSKWHSARAVQSTAATVSAMPSLACLQPATPQCPSARTARSRRGQTASREVPTTVFRGERSTRLRESGGQSRPVRRRWPATQGDAWRHALARLAPDAGGSVGQGAANHLSGPRRS